MSGGPTLVGPPSPPPPRNAPLPTETPGEGEYRMIRTWPTWSAVVRFWHRLPWWLITVAVLVVALGLGFRYGCNWADRMGNNIPAPAIAKQATPPPTGQSYASLKVQNEALRKEVERLAAENAGLKGQVAKLTPAAIPTCATLAPACVQFNREQGTPGSAEDLLAACLQALREEVPPRCQ